MSEKRFKIGEPVKVVSGMVKGITGTVDSYGRHHDYFVKFDKRQYGFIGSFYDDCNLEPADAVIEIKPGMVKFEIEIPALPEDKIPAGMKLGNPAYEHRIVVVGEPFICGNNEWIDASGFAGYHAIVANFVPCEPEEKEFIDINVYSSKAQLVVIDLPKSLTDGVSDYLRVNISYARTHRYFSCFVWADGVHFSDNAFYDGKRFCTHVRFHNPKYKDGK
jgi:hypothetical protein